MRLSHTHFSSNAIRVLLRIEGPKVEIGADVLPVDKLKFKDLKKYKDRIATAQKDTGEKEALIVLRGQVFGTPSSRCRF